MHTAGARAGEVLAGAPLDNGNVNPRQRELGRQHQPRRTSSSDHHRMLCHGRWLCGMTRGLPQALVSGISWKWRGTGVAVLFSECGHHLPHKTHLALEPRHRDPISCCHPRLAKVWRMTMTSQTEKGEKFARSHVEPGIVVLPNAWDAGSAIMMVEAGFPAIAPTRAGVAFALGPPGG